MCVCVCVHGSSLHNKAAPRGPRLTCTGCWCPPSLCPRPVPSRPRQTFHIPPQRRSRLDAQTDHVLANLANLTNGALAALGGWEVGGGTKGAPRRRGALVNGLEFIARQGKRVEWIVLELLCIGWILVARLDNLAALLGQLWLGTELQQPSRKRSSVVEVFELKGVILCRLERQHEMHRVQIQVGKVRSELAVADRVVLGDLQSDGMNIMMQRTKRSGRVVEYVQCMNRSMLQ